MDSWDTPKPRFEHPVNQVDGAILLELLTDTLSESWGLLMYLDCSVIWDGVLTFQLDEVRAHWKQQFEMVGRFLDVALEEGGFAYTAIEPVVAWGQLERFLRSELRFQTHLLSEIGKSFTFKRDEEELNDLVVLQSRLLRMQVAVVKRLGYVLLLNDSPVDTANSVDERSLTSETLVA